MDFFHHRGFHNFNRKSGTAFDPSLPSLAENGLAALLRAAADPRARGMEFDVEFCKETVPDTGLCVFHDETLADLTREPELRVENLSLEELSLKASQTKNPRFFDDTKPLAKVPSFKETMLALYNYTGTLSIELKVNIKDRKIYAQRFLTQLKHLPKNAEIIIHSFSLEILSLLMEAVLEACPKVKFAFNFMQYAEASIGIDRPDPSGLGELKRLQEKKLLFDKITYLYPDFNLIKAGASQRSFILELSQLSEKLLIVWTVNEASDLNELGDCFEAFISDNSQLS